MPGDIIRFADEEYEVLENYGRDGLVRCSEGGRVSFRWHFEGEDCVLIRPAAAPIDWHAEMRTCVGDAAELADRVSTSDSDVGGALGRLCNAVTHLLDENKALRERLEKAETDFAHPCVCVVGVVCCYAKGTGQIRTSRAPPIRRAGLLTRRDRARARPYPLVSHSLGDGRL